MWTHLLEDVQSGAFISTFCDPDDAADFSGQLGKFTPCFTDVFILGVGHIVAIIFYSTWLHYITRCPKPDKYRLQGSGTVLQALAVTAAGICVLIPLFQLNGRLGAQSMPLSSGSIAPHELAGLLLACFSFLLLTITLSMEFTRYVPSRRWLLRFPIVLVCASELVKLRFVLLLADQADSTYFFYMYLVYVAAQVWLALLALLWHPSESQLVLVHEGRGHPAAYMPLRAPSPTETSDSSGSPEDTASILSRITFSWMSPLMAHGYKEPLAMEDVYGVPKSDRLEAVDRTFRKHWGEQMAKGRAKASLFAALAKTVGPLFLTALPFKLINDASQFVGPTVLGLLLGVVAGDESKQSLGYVYAAVLFGATVTGVLSDNQHFQRVMRAGVRVKSVLNGEVHRKVFMLTPAARARFSSGKTYTLVSSDAETLYMLCQGLFGFVSSPLRITVAIELLFRQLGPSSLVAVAAILVVIPVNAVLVRKSALRLKRSLVHTDERTKLEGELMAGIEVVKCSTWEQPFLERIGAARTKELAQLLGVSILQAFTGFLIQSIPVIVPVVTFAAYLLLGHDLSAAEAFTSLSLFNILRFPLFALPQLVSQVTQARVSLTRLQDFLSAEELPPDHPTPAAKPGENAVSIHGDFGWDPSQAPSLTDINLDVQAGQLVALVGPTGSGKSTLLASILGLTQQAVGPPVVLRGRAAFVPQAPFIMGGTVRDNILFGRPFQEGPYRRAVEAAALEQDFAALPGGDMTELGDRGVNVSGGQKQRISIARALYSQADVVLLDDPLSALDAKVGRKVATNAIQGELRGKTVLLATNQLQFVAMADMVLFMRDGRITEAGSYQGLLDAGGEFAALMKEAQVEEAPSDGEPSDANGTASGVSAATKVTNGNAIVADGAMGHEAAAAGDIQPGTQKVSEGGQKPPEAAQKPPAAGAKLFEMEGSATGGVKASVVGAWIRAMGGPLAFGWLILLFVVVEGLRVGATVWLSVWTGEQDHAHDKHGAKYYMTIYAAISAGQLLMTLLNGIDVARYGQRASKSLHNAMLASLVRAPMSTFHTTPLGRIINRLTKDTSDIDRNLAGNVQFAFRSFLQLVSTVVMVGVVAPFALPGLVVVLALFYWLYLYFQTNARQVKRLDAVSRSPVLNSVSEAINGLATVRAFGAQERLQQRHAMLVDTSSAMALAQMSMNRWLSVRLESLGAFSTFLAAFVAVEQQGQNAALMGLLLSYALQITQVTSMTLRVTSVAENSFNSVERVEEYSHLPQEAALESEQEGGKAPEGWPQEGVVEFKDVRMRYRPGLPLVLHGVTFTVASQNKCGVVGRTGAGKSSMIATLFRLVELDGGYIHIDGINISRMGLHQLRSHLSLIPQVPVLFTGSIRSNLSPFGRHSDNELWAALRRAHLAPVVESFAGGLDHQLQEGGAPLSAGQKQLLALARALLNPSKVLVLDEATANVDVETDALIQRTMRTQFADRTIIAVAHRLHTVIDCDRVLVLDKGRVAEFGSPKQLLANPNGIFSGMVHDTGEATERFLRSAAAGEVDISQHYNAAAQHAMQAVALPPQAKPCLLSLSAELAERARAVSAEVGRLVAGVKVLAEEDEQLLTAGVLPNDSSVDVSASDHDASGVAAALATAMGQLQQLQDMAKDVVRLYEEKAAEHANSERGPMPHVNSLVSMLAGRSALAGDACVWSTREVVRPGDLTAAAGALAGGSSGGGGGSSSGGAGGSGGGEIDARALLAMLEREHRVLPDVVEGEERRRSSDAGRSSLRRLARVLSRQASRHEHEHHEH